MAKRVRVYLVTTAILLASFSSAANAAVKAGASCTKPGAISTSNGYKFTCIKSGKKLNWNKGVKVANPKPTIVSTPTSVPTATPVPTPSFVITPTTSLADVSTCKLNRPNGQNGISLGFPIFPERVKGPIIRALIMPVDFPDLIATTDPALDYKEMTLQISKWYSTLSGNRVKFEWVIYPKYIRMPQTVASYNVGARTGTGYGTYHDESIRAGDAYIDFSKFDLVVIGAPPNVKSEQISTSPAFPVSAGGGIKVDGVEVLNSTMTAEDSMRVQQDRPGWKLIAHEIGHLMGLMDLYNVHSTMDASGKPPTDEQQFKFMGGFAMMNHVHGNAPTFTAWEQWLLGFVPDSQIRCIASGSDESTHLIAPIELTTDSPHAVVISLSETKRIVIESRRSIGYDIALGSSNEGALVYMVDITKSSGDGPISIIKKPDVKSPLLYDALLKKGESITYENYKITNLASDKNGDTIRVEKVAA